MKQAYVLAISVMACLVSTPLIAANIAGPQCTLHWGSVEDVRVEGYYVYVDGSRTAEVVAPATAIACGPAGIPLRADATVYVTSYGHRMESEPSNSIVAWWDDSDMSPPQNFRISSQP